MPPHRRCAHDPCGEGQHELPTGCMTMRWLNQIAELTFITLWMIPQRLGTSLVIVIGIAGVVGVLVSVLAMSEGFRHTLASTGRQDRVILLRAGSDAELSSGLRSEERRVAKVCISQW